MKKLIFPHRRLHLVLGAISCLALISASGAEPDGATNVPQPADAKPATAPANLPYGASDVIKLSQAQISEGIILNYVQNSGTAYDLSPQDIVNLRNQGVSDHVINAMLNQRKKLAEVAAQNSAQRPPPVTQTPAPVYRDNNPAPDNTQTGPAYAEAPLVPAPSSSVYVIPYPAARYAYYGSPYYYSPYYYGGYYGPYYGPTISLGFGFGHGFGFHGYHGYGGGFHAYGGHGGHWGGGGHHR